MNFILSLLTLWVMGFCLNLILFRKNFSQLPLLERLALSYFMGIGIVTYQLFIYYLLNIPFDFTHIIWAPLLSIVFIGGYFLKNNKSELKSHPAVPRIPLVLTEKILLVFILLQIGWIFYLVFPMPVNSYDALASYAFKAKIFYFTQGIPQGFFNWSETQVNHPDYPLMLPFLMTWVYIFTGFDDVVITKIMPITLIFFLLLFYSHLKTFFNRRYALFGIFFICSLRQVVNYVTIIHADFFLMAYTTCGFLYFLRYTKDLNRQYLLAASCLFAFSLCLKSEGMIFTCSYILCFIFFIRNMSRLKDNRPVKDFFISLTTIILIAGPWFLLKSSTHMVNSDVSFSKLTLERFLNNLVSLPAVFYEFQIQVFGPRKWNIFWVVILIILWVYRRKLFKGRNLYVTFFLITCVSIYLIGYTLFTGYTVAIYANKTMSRFMIHLASLSLFWAMCLARALSTKTSPDG